MNISNHLSDLICPCCGTLKNTDGTCPKNCMITVQPIDIPLEVEEVKE